MAPEVLPPPQTIEVGKAVIINEQTVVRETEEETGITVEPILELHLEEMILTRGHRKGNIYKVHSYLCRVISGSPTLSNEHHNSQNFV